jgi:hypothetical protein
MPVAEVAARSAFQVDVRHGADQIAVNDLLTITASVRHATDTVTAGMVVRTAVPTGFAPETPTLRNWLKVSQSLLGYRRPQGYPLHRRVCIGTSGLSLPSRRAPSPGRGPGGQLQAYAYYRLSGRARASAAR